MISSTSITTSQVAALLLAIAAAGADVRNATEPLKIFGRAVEVQAVCRSASMPTSPRYSGSFTTFQPVYAKPSAVIPEKTCEGHERQSGWGIVKYDDNTPYTSGWYLNAWHDDKTDTWHLCKPAYYWWTRGHDFTDVLADRCDLWWLPGHHG